MHGKTAADLESDWELEHKVTRSLEIMGEAAGRISEKTKNIYPDIPWREIKSVRNRITHQYYELNYQVVFDIVHQELPKLTKQLGQLVTDLKKNQSKRLLLAKQDKPVLLQKKRHSKRRGLGL